MASDFNIVRATLKLFAFIVVMICIRLGIRFFRRRRRNPDAPIDRCRCGYILENLSVARCPECGRVIHFDATPEQLGLTEEELQRAQAARLRRRKDTRY